MDYNKISDFRRGEEVGSVIVKAMVLTFHKGLRSGPLESLIPTTASAPEALSEGTQMEKNAHDGGVDIKIWSSRDVWLSVAAQVTIEDTTSRKVKEGISRKQQRIPGGCTKTKLPLTWIRSAIQNVDRHQFQRPRGQHRDMTSQRCLVSREAFIMIVAREGNNMASITLA